ncbi:MAG TPA: YggT family protein [Acidimicrobiales bacterium]|jgi:YggT family protein|nr:YggT family protein [Acidimicrobiales bacterium]
MILRIIADLLQLYLLCLFIRIILSWFPINPWGNGAKVARLFEKITDPVLVPLRRVVPPLRIGGGAVDLSPLIVLVALEIVINTLRRSAY